MKADSEKKNCLKRLNLVTNIFVSHLFICSSHIILNSIQTCKFKFTEPFKEKRQLDLLKLL